jgi:hypothetical protein
MKNSNVSPAVAAAELLRRRREALTERFATGLEEGALRLKGCHYDELDEGTQGLVAQQVMETLTESELENLVAIMDQIAAVESSGI